MEDFGYSKNREENQTSSLIKRAMLLGMTLFSLACFGYITVSAYYFFVSNSNNVEIIKASANPIKIVEIEENLDNQDGMKIDSTIYEDIFGTRKKNQDIKIKEVVEPAIPPKKEIISQNSLNKNVGESIQTSESLKKETIVDNKKSDSKTNTPNPPQNKIIVYSTQEKISKNELKNSENTSTNKNDSLSNKTLTTNEPSEKNKKQSTTEKRKYIRVQIAALTSKEAANQYFLKLENQFPNLFSGLKEYIEEVDLGKRGIFFRLQIGNFFDQVRAENFCNKYTMQTQKSRADCIIVE